MCTVFVVDGVFFQYKLVFQLVLVLCAVDMIAIKINNNGQSHKNRNRSTSFLQIIAFTREHTNISIKARYLYEMLILCVLREEKKP